MFNLLGNKKIEAFGLDISNVSIKAMMLGKKNNGLFPLAFSDIQIPGNIISNHMITNEEKLADQIKRAVSAAGKISSKYVVASVPEAKSFVRLLNLPKLSESELDSSIPWELEADIPVPVDQVYLDWMIINQQGDKLDVLVMATPKDYVDTLVSSIKSAGFKPAALELESQATARALVSSVDSSSAVLILDIASILTSFVIIENGVLQYTSSIPLGGNALTESIARNLGVSAPDAEKMKRELGLLSDTKKGNIRQAILPILDNIVDEIKNVARFHEEHSVGKKPISKVILAGGGGKLLGITDYISARLNLGAAKPIGRVVLGDPWVNVIDSSMKEQIPLPKEQALGLATVTGLALRGASYAQ
ncbi:MAG: type IV pilus assembly protein PilM [Candidatus Doudnabacteria bacterium]|nr:type IV pilus assembly protein PilM [Candidatus Doudnabacteria bacterium]